MPRKAGTPGSRPAIAPGVLRMPPPIVLPTATARPNDRPRILSRPLWLFDMVRIGCRSFRCAASRETAQRRSQLWSAAAADGWLAARGGAHGWRLFGFRLRLAAVRPAGGLLAVGGGRRPIAGSEGLYLVRSSCYSRAHRRKPRARRQPPPPTIADSDVSKPNNDF